MEKEHMTAAEFADAIGVQRSSVSHVLNGRNNPSSTFLQKILTRFPNIDSRWLLLGEGNEPKSSGGSLFELTSEPSKAMPEVKPENPQPRSSDPMPENLFQMVEPQAQASHTTQKTTPEKQRRISRIVIFYDDKTFSEYYPGE